MRITWNRDRFEILDTVKGETYEHKETIKQAGGTWDQANRVWYVSPEHQRLESLRGLKPTIASEAKAHFDALEGKKQAMIKASKATAANIEIPCPPGLSLLPYQKAGILFALKVFGDLK